MIQTVTRPSVRAALQGRPPLPPAAEDDARQVLAWAVETFGERLLVASSLGPQTTIVLDLLHRMGRSVRTVFLDTDLHFPETYALKRTLETRYGIEIEAARPALDVAEQAARFGPALWETQPDRCCALRKVEPLRELLGGAEAWITGLRRSQGRARSQTQTVEWDEQYGLVKINPLAGWSRAQVERYTRVHELPRNGLREQGYTSVGCWPCTRPATDDDERSGRWAGFAKTECGLHLGTVRGATVGETSLEGGVR